MCLSRQRRFPRERRSVPAARSFAVETLFLWGLVERYEDMRLCVSELATNAVAHGVPPGREFSLRLTAEGQAVRIEVRDTGDGNPQAAQPDGEQSGGRGLYLVSVLADDFGVLWHSVGKTVWCAFDLVKGRGDAPVGPDVRGLADA